MLQPHGLRLLVEGEQVVTLDLDALETAFGEPFPTENHIPTHFAVPTRSVPRPIIRFKFTLGRE